MLRPCLLLLGLLMTVSTPLCAQSPEGKEDQFQWLEEVLGDQPLDWVKQQNGQSTGELSQSPRFQQFNDRILQILDSNAKIPMISKAGDWYYNFWRDAKNRRGLWRRTTLEKYRQATPEWETVLDLDELGKQEGENWVWKGATFLKPGYDRVLLSLSRGGADATVTREFDVAKRQFITDGFVLPEAKTRIGWRDRDSVFVGTDTGPGSLTDSGYPRTVREWQRGTPLSEAPIVYEGEAADVSVSGTRSKQPGYERDWFSRAVTFWTSEVFLRRDGKLLKIEKPDDAKFSSDRELIFIELRTAWEVGGKKHPAGALLAANLEEFLKGERKFDVLFEPTDRKSLDDYAFTRHHVLLNELDNVRSRLYVLTRENGQWKREELPGAPRLSSVGVSPIDPDETDEYFMTVTDYLTPTSLFYGNLGNGPAEKLKENPQFFKTDGLSVAQYEAVSADGTRIPYFQVSRQPIALNGKNPTLLYGYGGFEISMTPTYQPNVGAAWLENGGVYVVANIRGGGEFGPKWHQAALKKNRHKAYEDFIAVGEDLVKRGVTAPQHLGTMGGSNGGLLMGNMLTRRPDLFGAIVCQVPLLDMRRFNKLLAGASWMAEYGNPDVPEEWEFIRTFSPYHNVDPKTEYPRTLFTTSTRDDRVHPGHARKMVALMKDQGHDVLYYENIEGGHGGAADNKQSAYMWSLAYTFLWNQLDPKK
ncbi:MAG: prolyl oligopeptidase family serine peptidase [Planctomycetaceae bacterium]